MSSPRPDSPRRLTLGHGLTLLVEPQRHAPVVALQAWVRAGGADESAEVLGVAHLHEHMLFKGTRRRGVGEVAREVEAAGGEINAWTSFDETVYHLTLGRESWALGLDILMDVLCHSAFDSQELGREREVVLEEIRRAADSPGRRLSQAVFTQAFGSHPYARPVLGHVETVAAMTRAQVVGFYRHFYRPDNVTFVVVGDVDAEAVAERLGALAAGWVAPAAPLVRPARPPARPLPTATAQVLAEPVREVRLAMSWLGPALTDPAVAAFDAMSMVLGHGETSLLHEALRRRAKLAHDVHAYAYTPRERGLLWIGAGLFGPDVGPVVAACLAELAALAADGPPPELLEQVRTALLSDAAYQRESVQGQARKRGFFEVTGGDWQLEERYLGAVQKLVPEDVRRVAEQILATPPGAVLQVPAAEAGRYPSAATLAAMAGAAPGPARARAPRPGQGPQVAAAAWRPPASPAWGEVERHELRSGAVLLVRHEPGEVVAMRAMALGGQRWEDAATAGLGHLFGRVLGQASTGLDSRQLAEAWAGLGGGVSGVGGRHSVGLAGTVLADRAAAGAALFAETLARAHFAEADLGRCRDEVLEAIAAREDAPQALAGELFDGAVYAGHPSARPLMGERATVAAVGVETLEACARRFLAPGRLVLAACGRVDTEALVRVWEEALGDAPAAPLPPPMVVRDPPPRQVHRALDRQQSQVVVGAPGLALGHPDRFAAEVGIAVLSGQGGRLFGDLRDRQSLCYSVYAHQALGLDAGQVSVFMAVHPAKVAQAIAGVHHHLDRLLEAPPAAAELDRARRYLIGGHQIGRQSVRARCAGMALNELVGLGYDADSRVPQAIAEVSAEDVLRVARALWARERRIQVTVGPGEAPTAP